MPSRSISAVVCRSWEVTSWRLSARPRPGDLRGEGVRAGEYLPLVAVSAPGPTRIDHQAAPRRDAAGNRLRAVERLGRDSRTPLRRAFGPREDGAPTRAHRGSLIPMRSTSPTLATAVELGPRQGHGIGQTPASPLPSRPFGLPNSSERLQTDVSTRNRDAESVVSVPPFGGAIDSRGHRWCHSKVP